MRRSAGPAVEAPPPLPPTARSQVPRTARRVAVAWRSLDTPTVRPQAFAASMVADLPEAARRYLQHTIAPGTPLWGTVRVAMDGQLRLGSWRRFSAEQVVAPGRGYIWTATARVLGVPVTGYDRYSDGTAEMRWRLLGAVPVVSVDGPDTVRSAAGRLASEMALLPTAFRGAVWRDGPDPDTTIATWEIDGGVHEVRLHVGPRGQLLDVLVQRWGQPPGAELGTYPFGVTVLSEQTWAGVTLPARFRAGWWWGTPREDDGEFFRGHLTSATFG